MKTLHLIAFDLFENRKDALDSEWESKSTLKKLKDTLEDLGDEVISIQKPLNIVQKIIDLKKNSRTFLVWNLTEGFLSRNRESYIPAICEYLGVAHSGSDAYAQAVTLDKIASKEIAKKLSIPTPNFQMITHNSFPSDLTFPVFAKPVYEGSSLGIDEESIIHDSRNLLAKVDSLQKLYGNVLLEECIEGNDWTIGVLEIGGKYRVSRVARVAYPGAVYDQKTKSKYQMIESLEWDVPKETEEIIQEWSLRFCKYVGIEGYARLDYKGNPPMFLECNATPGLSETYSLFPKLWGSMKYSELLLLIRDSGLLASKQRRFQYGKEYS